MLVKLAPEVQGYDEITNLNVRVVNGAAYSRMELEVEALTRLRHHSLAPSAIHKAAE